MPNMDSIDKISNNSEDSVAVLFFLCAERLFILHRKKTTASKFLATKLFSFPQPHLKGERLSSQRRTEESLAFSSDDAFLASLSSSKDFT